MIHDVVKAEYINGYRIRVVFDDGRDGIVDFSSYLGVGGVFDRFHDMEFFKSFSVDPELGVLTWGGEIDIAPETLYCKATGEPLPDWMVAEAPKDETGGY
jgi:hypothetical protein